MVLAYLANLPGIALVGVFGVILQRFRASEFMVARWRSTDITLTGDLAREACYRAGYWI
jgi:hypothetical protein